MFSLKKAAALAAGFVAAVTVVNLSPQLAAQGTGREPEALVVEEATVDWIEKSNVAALREGVIERMELQIGMPVEKNKPIGYLHDEIARLAVRKAEVAVKKIGPMEKALAQKELGKAKLAISDRLNARVKGAVSYEEIKQQEAEYKVAHAMTLEADEQTKSDQVELDLAKQTLEEHIIRAPFAGIIIERMKHPGEKVGQNEPVVQLGNLDRLRAYAYVPLEYAFRVKEGQAVEFQPRLVGAGNVPQAIEKKKFRGKIQFVDPQIQPIAETAVRIYAEFDNPDHDLRPGLKGTLTIYLGSEGAAPPQPQPTGTSVGARTAPASAPR
jgi:RND family efflux transporter MFP subunit